MDRKHAGAAWPRSLGSALACRARAIEATSRGVTVSATANRGFLSSAAPSLPEKVVALGKALAAARIPHAFGGALALAYYAEPRATIDVDVNVFVRPERHPEVQAALAPLGVSARADPGDLIRDGQARWWWGDIPVDLFFSYDAIHDAMQEAIRQVPFGDRRIPILAPEHLLVCKAAFDRPKDWLDIEQMLLLADGLDHEVVRFWMKRIVGEGDPRFGRVEELMSRGAEPLSGAAARRQE